MNRYVFCRVACMALVLSLMQAAPTFAQAGKKDGARDKEMARRVQQMQQEKTRLEQEKTELNEKLGDLTSQVKAADAREEVSRRQLAEARRANAELTRKFQAAEVQIADVGRRLEETAGRLRQREREKSLCENVVNEQVDILGRQSRSISSCQEHNVKLGEVARTLLDRLRKDASAAGDPVLGLGMTDAFANFQELRDQVDAQRIDSPRIQP